MNTQILTVIQTRDDFLSVKREVEKNELVGIKER
jgi:hypothetical protein